jgi:hypothetical protein
MGHVVINVSQNPKLALAHNFVITAFDEARDGAKAMIAGLGTIADDVFPDYRDGQIAIPSADAKLRRKRGGQLASYNPTIGTVFVSAVPAGGEVRIDKWALEDDKYAAAIVTAKQLGMRAATRRIDVLRGDPSEADKGILAGLTLIWDPDGKTFYADDHPVDWDDPGGSTWSNKFALTLSRDNYRTVRAAMYNAPDQSGRARALRPSHLIVGSANESLGREIVVLDSVAGIGKNPDYDSGIELVVVPELTTEWLLASAGPGGEKPIGYWLRSDFAPTYKGAQETDDGEDHVWKVEGRDGIAFKFPHRLFYSKP